MSDPLGDTPPGPLPRAVRRLALPWWRGGERTATLVAALEGAVAAGEEVVEFSDRRVTVKWLAEEADGAR
jgi:hypothetical protein